MQASQSHPQERQGSIIELLPLVGVAAPVDETARGFELRHLQCLPLTALLDRGGSLAYCACEAIMADRTSLELLR